MNFNTAAPIFTPLTHKKLYSPNNCTANKTNIQDKWAVKYASPYKFSWPQFICRGRTSFARPPLQYLGYATTPIPHQILSHIMAHRISLSDKPHYLPYHILRQLVSFSFAVLISEREIVNFLAISVPP